MARLDSIKNPQPRPPPQAKKTLSLKCPNPDCDANDPADEDGKTVCLACGTVILESQMVSEVVYGLASGGQHVVHGFHVGADQTYAKRGDVVDKTRAVDSQELTAQYGESLQPVRQQEPTDMRVRPCSHY